jgi:hypothetical protein
MKLSGQQSHERNISVSTYQAGEDHIVSEGRLVDDRKKDYYLYTGEKADAGFIHNLVIRLLIKSSSMVIEDVEVEMQHYPRNECIEMEKSLDCVKGLSLTKGFIANIKSMFQKDSSCTHLVHLIITMAPAIMQGYWALKAQEPFTNELSDYEKMRIIKTGESLINTCYVWRKGGPAHTTFLRMLKDHEIEL